MVPLKVVVAKNFAIPKKISLLIISGKKNRSRNKGGEKKKIRTEKESPWITDPGEGKLYADDSVEKIKGIGGKTKEKFEAAGVKTVMQFFDLHDNEEGFKTFSKQVRSSLSSSKVS